MLFVKIHDTILNGAENKCRQLKFFEVNSVEKRLEREAYLKDHRHMAIARRAAHTFPLHAHEYFELEILLSGEGIHRINGTEYRLERGSLYLLSPSDFHEIEITKEATLWNLVFDETMLAPDWLEMIFSSGTLCRTADEHELSKLNAACELLLDEADHNGCIRPLMEYVLNVVVQSAAKKEQLTPIRRAILFIGTHFRENPSLEQTAAVACLSPVYFGNLFKKATGQTYVRYLNERKVACSRMLLESGMSVTEACFSSGFGSLSGFLNSFHKIVGTSPAAYRKAMLKKTK